MTDYDKMPLAGETPYPPIKVNAKNPKYARWMLDNMGGFNSEMSAVSLYLYNNLITEYQYSDISKIFFKINMVEMHHLHIFGQLAFALGEDPKLWTQRRGRKAYWSPSYNEYPVNLSRLLEHALEGEIAAVDKYAGQINCIEDSCIVENLKRIIIDEELHIQIFRRIISEYCPQCQKPYV